MSTVQLKAVEVFRTGDYPQGKFSSVDLQKIVERYDVNFLKAPNTLDHAQSGPAYGHVTSLSTDGVLLFADLEVTPDLADQIKAKKYLSRSVEFFRDLEGKGPYLKAVSWLGAKAPQVKGLADVDFTQFSEAKTAVIEFTKPIQSEEVVSFEALQAKIATLEQEKTALAAQFSQTELERNTAREALHKLEMNQSRLRFEQFLNEQIAFGTLAPTNKALAMNLLEALNAVTMFENTDKSAVELFQEFIANQPKVQFSQSVKADSIEKPLTLQEAVAQSHQSAKLTTV